MRGLRGKAIIVTGAASGIGRAVAERLAEEGAVVGIFDLNAEGAERAAGSIRQSGLKAAAYAVDITDYAAVAKAVAAFEEAAGPIEGLVNNAGWDKAGPFVRSNPADWKKIVDINLYGPLNMTHVVLQGMAQRGRGRIVSVSSDAGRVGSSGEGVYSACKGGIIAFTKTVALELAKYNITVNVVAPGFTETDMLAKVPENVQAQILSRIPLGRFGLPEEIAKGVVFLAADGDYITGAQLNINGGAYM